MDQTRWLFLIFKIFFSVSATSERPESSDESEKAEKYMEKHAEGHDGVFMLLNHDLTAAMALPNYCITLPALLLEEDTIFCLLPPLVCLCLTEESLCYLKSNGL